MLKSDNYGNVRNQKNFFSFVEELKEEEGFIIWFLMSLKTKKDNKVHYFYNLKVIIYIITVLQMLSQDKRVIPILFADYW